jgi:hypothetical protein
VSTSPGWPRLAVYALPLREYLPIAHHSTFTRLFEELEELAGLEMRTTAELPSMPGFGGRRFVSLRVWQAGSQQDLSDYELLGNAFDVLKSAGLRVEKNEDATPPEPESAQYRTVIEAVTVVRDQDELESGDPLSLCIQSLNDIIRSYRIVENIRIPELTYERITPVVPYFLRGLDSPRSADGPRLMILNHGNVRTAAPKVLAPSELDRTMQVLERLLIRDPLVIYAERRLEANIALHRDGQYAEAAIQAAIAAEVLLSSTLAMLLWEESFTGADPEEAISLLSRDLAKRVRTGFHDRLKGSWQLAGNGPVANWYSRTAALRNRVVHGGYRPDKAEARASLDGLMRLEKFLCDHLARNRTTYPRTTLAMLGRAGLDSRNMWSDAIFGDDVIGPINEATRHFVAWRDKIDGEIEARRRRS